MSGVYVVLEDRGGRIGRISWEAVAAANLLAAQSGAKATAIVIGAQTEALATEAATKGIAKVVRHRASAAGAIHSRWIHGST